METLEHKIEQLVNKINKFIFTTESSLTYDELHQAFIDLCDLAKDIEGDTEHLWYIGESSYCTLDSLLIGAYWHYTEWHAGQNSLSYAALCSIGSIFSPGMSDGPEDGSSERDVYNMLDVLACPLLDQLAEEATEQ